jgi:hypothetical protein
LELKTKLKLDDIQDSENVAELLNEETLDEIGRDVVQKYDIDESSRRKWTTRMTDATELALQITQEKTYPWPNAANIKFPLLTIASLQFASRAYPALVKAPDLVKYRVQGRDQDGAKAARAGRISAHMSYQLLEQDEGWEEDQDKAFLALPILGCVFKKSYYDSVLEHNVSKVVLPKNLVVHYYAKSIEEAERKTEIFELHEREVRERVLRGVFTDHEYGPPPAPREREEDVRQGTSAPLDDKDSPRVFLEQHSFLDLDGDGYKEPYVITVEKESRKVARIVARIDEVVTEQSIKIEELQKRMRALAEGLPQPQPGQPISPQQMGQVNQAEATINEWNSQVEELAKQEPTVIRIKPIEYYTKYSFIPSPDGGFYDLGFGALLGPINDSVNTILNQLVDAGTLQNGSMGFIGKGARIKGGKLRFSPFEWKRVDVAGGQLKDSLVPLPVNAPSDVLFNLLSLLITYAERVGSVTDAMMGENPGQNTPAYNMSAMLEQGLQVFNGIFKRVYRSFRGELRKLYKLNSIYLDQEEYFAYQDDESGVSRTDYTADPKDLIPAADPNAFSSKEKLAKAQAVREAAMTTAGYDMMKVEQRFLEALDIPDAAELFPVVQNEETGAMELAFPPQPDPQLELERSELELKALDSQASSEIDAALAESTVKLNEAKIIEIMARADLAEDSPELERLKILQKEQQSIREQLVEREKINASKQIASSKDNKAAT